MSLGGSVYSLEWQAPAQSNFRIIICTSYNVLEGHSDISQIRNVLMSEYRDWIITMQFGSGETRQGITVAWIEILRETSEPEIVVKDSSVHNSDLKNNNNKTRWVMSFRDMSLREKSYGLWEDAEKTSIQRMSEGRIAHNENLAFFFFFSGPHPRHMEVPRLWAESEL